MGRGNPFQGLGRHGRGRQANKDVPAAVPLERTARPSKPDAQAMGYSLSSRR
jgi:hypothetical protein